MSNLLRILLFVPPMFLFSLPLFSQLSGHIEQNPLNGEYTVSVIPSVTWMPPTSATSQANITLRAATGTLQVIDFQSITGTWSMSGPFVSPSEAPGYDYLILSESVLITNLTYTAGVPKPLFKFRNNHSCTSIEIIDNNTDPLNVEPNSISIGVANFFNVIAAGNGNNAYIGNSAQASTTCPPLNISVTAAVNPVKCNGDQTDMTISASGGQAPYSVVWQNLTTGQSNMVAIQNLDGSTVLTGMNPGNYEFQIIDNLDSSFVTNYFLQNPGLLEVTSISPITETCKGTVDGGVILDNVRGGTGFYHYQWENLPNETDSILLNVGSGLYSVTITDDNGCTATASQFVGDGGTINFANTVVRNSICNGIDNGLIDLYPISPTGSAFFQFTWSDNAQTGDESAAWMLGPGTYSVTVTDLMGGCIGESSFSINEPPAIEVDYRLSEPKCYGDKGALEILGVSNAVEPWEAKIDGFGNFEAGYNFVLEPGVPLKLIVEDKNGCTTSEDFIVADRQALLLEIGESQDIKYGETVEISPDFFPFDHVSFNWTPAEGLSCTDCPDPIVKPTEGVTYRLEMTDSAGCTIEDYINIEVRKSRDIFIPNAFSPNFDGINDAFYPYGGFEIVAIHNMQVFDRWGNLMFNASEKFSPNDENAGWKGTAREKDKLADPGTYLYTMNVEFVDGEIILFSGEVTLMK